MVTKYTWCFVIRWCRGGGVSYSWRFVGMHFPLYDMILSQRHRTGPGHELAGLHYIRQDLCVHHEDGGGVNRGRKRQGCLRWTCNFLPSEVRRRTFKFLSPRVWIHVMSLNLTARAREKDCFRKKIRRRTVRQLYKSIDPIMNCGAKIRMHKKDQSWERKQNWPTWRNIVTNEAI